MCAPIWFYLQDYTRMHGQQNMKFFSKIPADGEQLIYFETCRG